MEEHKIEIVYTSEFKRNLKILAKKYRHIQEDIEPIIRDLQAGKKLGEQIIGVDKEVFKVRIRNRDSQKGKSGGYRCIYYVQTSEKIVLITIYSKTEQSDISNKCIKEIIEAFETDFFN